jgi:hypothetical protein
MAGLAKKWDLGSLKAINHFTRKKTSLQEGVALIV